MVTVSIIRFRHYRTPTCTFVHNPSSRTLLLFLEHLPKPTLLYLPSFCSLCTGQGPFASAIEEFALVPLSYLTLFGLNWWYRHKPADGVCLLVRLRNPLPKRVLDCLGGIIKEIKISTNSRVIFHCGLSP